MTAPSKWPKVFSPLTEEQRQISDDFMKYWHEVLRNRFSVVDHFNQTYAVRHSPPGFRTTLEIGAGSGEHLHYEKLTPEQEANYHALELRENMGAVLRSQFPRIQVTIGDCQASLPFEDGHFDRILAIHVLEHLPDLPSTVRQMHRVINKQRGVLLAVIPCEGGLLYGMCRRISAQRIFERRYKQSYRWFIEREHLSLPHEILEELSRCFHVEQRSFFPLPLPVVSCNLCIGLRLVPL